MKRAASAASLDTTRAPSCSFAPRTATMVNQHFTWSPPLVKGEAFERGRDQQNSLQPRPAVSGTNVIFTVEGARPGAHYLSKLQYCCPFAGEPDFSRARANTKMSSFGPSCV